MTHRRYFVRRDAEEFALEVEPTAPGQFRVRVPGHAEPLEVSLLASGATSAVLVGGRALELFRLTTGMLVAHPTRDVLSVSTRSANAGRRAGTAEEGRALSAPMPGRVVKALVAVGATVAAGEPVIVIEAMKMENELVAPRAGVVRVIHVKAGDTVERDAPLLELE